MTRNLAKTYDPKSFEDRIYEEWESKGAFRADRDPDKKPFCIVMPPPNITGQLHMGHALDQTLQDVLTRFKRLQGYSALWLPGSDHASIATEVKVVEKLREEGIEKDDLGREEFLKHAWEWKRVYGGKITEQCRKLGDSCDWERERFTMDEGCNRAVRHFFVQLYNKGLIYKGNRLINWCPECGTSLSDAEVEHEDKNGLYWYFRYPGADGSEGVVVATSRPETMFGDVAIAVHPSDERYKDLVGKTVVLPLVGKEIPVIADPYPDPEKGTGAVKITPAHDENDFMVGQRNDLPSPCCINEDATMNELAGKYAGMDRYECRKEWVKDLEEAGYLVKTEEMVIPAGTCYRCHTVVEPMLSDQWFVKMEDLAKPAIEAARKGDLRHVPERFEKIYLHWLEEIRDWCISRQHWWGHRIPAWYCQDCGEIIVAEDTPDKCTKCGSTNLKQDEDVLDTWFSSGLWPFSTLGWPEETSDLKRFYPTHTLVTGFDIIFFWVARMMMMGLHFQDRVPFKRVFINALIRDEKGQKMSKSKGNVMDPLELVDAYGCDALRFTLTAMSGQARDIKLSRQRIEGYRNFGTKLWNAARFCQMNECLRVEGFDPGAVGQTLNRWIRGETVKTAHEVTRALEACAFDDAANALYRFIWNVFCDWHLELAKPILNGDDEAAKAETRATTAWVLDVILKLLHPVTPFITEELWDKLAEFGGPPRAAGEAQLITARWPDLPLAWIDVDAESEIGLIVGAVGEGRSVRSELNVPPSARPHLIVVDASAEQQAIFQANAAVIASTLRVGGVRFEAAAPHGAIAFVVDGATLALPVAEFIDLSAEKARLAKEVGVLAADVERTAKKLGNPDFVARAKEEVVEETRERLAEAEAAKAKLEAALRRLVAAD